MKIEILPAEASHITAIASRVRPDDERELFDFAGVTAREAMAFGIGASRIALTGLVDGEAVCMFGVSTISAVGNVGRVWMVGTDLLDKYSKIFLRRCAPEVAKMLCEYQRLENCVDVRNDKAIAWLLWLGFKFDLPVPMGLRNMSFIPFYKERKNG